MPKIVKARHWGMVVYPESVPSNWVDLLMASGLKCAISPLHDKDIQPDGSNEDKKAHWHVIACWDGPTTYNVAKTITDMLHAPIPVKLESVRGYYRYFTHMDHPDKYQYDPTEIQHLNGFAIADYVELTRSERLRLLGEVHDYIRKYDIHEYADLLDTLRDGGMMELYEVAATSTLVFRGYIASRRHQAGGRSEGADG